MPVDTKYSRNILDNLFLDRKHFANVYQQLLVHQNKEYVSILSVYSAIIKDRKMNINFNNFIVPYYVFKQLNIIVENNNTSAFVYSINKNIKTDLNKSSIYNSLNLIKKTSGN